MTAKTYCKDCDGLGYRDDIDNPTRHIGDLRCPNCDGTGEVETKAYPYWELSAEDNCPKCLTLLELLIDIEGGEEVINAERCPNGCYKKVWQ